MHSSIRIHLLKDHIKDIPILAKVLYEEWSNVYCSLGYQDISQVETELRNTSQNVDKIPLTFVAYDTTNNKLVCTASIDCRDLPTSHPYGFTSYWVNCVYTFPEYRGKGYCNLVMKQVIRKAKAMSLHCLWLYTENMEKAYQKLGFQMIERCKFQSQNITIMRWDNTQIQSKL